MKLVLRIAVALAALVVLLVVGGITALHLLFPKVGDAPDLQVASTPERIERGRYLAESVSGCIACHSERDFRYYAGPVVAGSWGRGGERYTRAMGLPGEFHAPNITPAALGDWTDGEILRAVTTGVARDGRAMFPIMPYPDYSGMSRDDAEAIVAFLRTLAPIEHEVRESVIDFPMNLIVRLIPQEAQPASAPDPADEVAYGRYMATIGGCSGCHTPMAGGQPDTSRVFAGGHAYPMPWGVSRAANITPDPDTGIGGWTRGQFIARFKTYEDTRDLVAVGALNTIMLWTLYAKMTRRDLGAIFAYLQTQKPVRNEVVRFTPP